MWRAIITLLVRTAKKHAESIDSACYFVVSLGTLNLIICPMGREQE